MWLQDRSLGSLVDCQLSALDTPHFLPGASFSTFKARKAGCILVLPRALSALSVSLLLPHLSASAAFQGQRWIIFPYYSFQLFRQKRNIFVVLLVDYIVSILVSRKLLFFILIGVIIFILFLYDKIHCFK